MTKLQDDFIAAVIAEMEQKAPHLQQQSQVSMREGAVVIPFYVYTQIGEETPRPLVIHVVASGRELQLSVAHIESLAKLKAYGAITKFERLKAEEGFHIVLENETKKMIIDDMNKNGEAA